MQQIWLVTGVSGSGRIEMLVELQNYAKEKGKKVRVIDVGKVIEQKARENRIAFVADKILNLDQATLSLLRVLAIQAINKDISNDSESDIIFIGMHALFLWKGRLLPGVSYSDLLALNINGIINVVDDVITIQNNNYKNPKWGKKTPSPASLQRWMMEEELLSDVFAAMKKVPMYVLARHQEMSNLFSFFFEKKKRIYLSFPITAIRGQPDLLDKIQEQYKPNLEKQFFVFNPLDIKDKTHVSIGTKDINKLIQDIKDKASDSVDVEYVKKYLEPDSVEYVDTRTIDRDYRFIAQSDAVVVIYPTDKLSPGVFSEMIYAHSHQVPVYMFFNDAVSPFLKEIATIYKDESAFFKALNKFAEEKANS